MTVMWKQQTAMQWKTFNVWETLWTLGPEKLKFLQLLSQFSIIFPHICKLRDEDI